MKLERSRKVPEVAKQLGIASPEPLRRWVRQAEIDRGLKAGPTSEELTEIKALRREVADQQWTIEILKAATTYFAQGGRPATAVMVSFVDAHRTTWPVVIMCRTIGLSERTYHAAKQRPSRRSVSDALEMALWRCDLTYGAPASS